MEYNFMTKLNTKIFLKSIRNYKIDDVSTLLYVITIIIAFDLIMTESSVETSWILRVSYDFLKYFGL